MDYAGLAGALLGVAAVIWAIYGERFSDGKRVLIVAAGFVLFVVSVWRL
jgi:hypothetical protein